MLAEVDSKTKARMYRINASDKIAIYINQIDITASKSDSSAFDKKLCNTTKCAGKIAVIRVEPGKDIPCCMPKPLGNCCSLTTIRTNVHIAQPWLISAYNFNTPISAATIHDDILKIW